MHQRWFLISASSSQAADLSAGELTRQTCEATISSGRFPLLPPFFVFEYVKMNTSFAIRTPFFNIVLLHLAATTKWEHFAPRWTSSQRYSFPCPAEDVTITELAASALRHRCKKKNCYFDPERGGGKKVEARSEAHSARMNVARGH